MFRFEKLNPEQLHDTNIPTWNLKDQVLGNVDSSLDNLTDGLVNWEQIYDFVKNQKAPTTWFCCKGDEPSIEFDDTISFEFLESDRIKIDIYIRSASIIEPGYSGMSLVVRHDPIGSFEGDAIRRKEESMFVSKEEIDAYKLAMPEDLRRSLKRLDGPDKIVYDSMQLLSRFFYNVVNREFIDNLNPDN